MNFLEWKDLIKNKITNDPIYQMWADSMEEEKRKWAEDVKKYISKENIEKHLSIDPIVFNFFSILDDNKEIILTISAESMFEDYDGNGWRNEYYVDKKEIEEFRNRKIK